MCASIALHELLERGVRREPCRRVGALAHHLTGSGMVERGERRTGRRCLWISRELVYARPLMAHHREEAAVYPAYAFLAHNTRRAVHEPAEAGVRRLRVVDQLRPAGGRKYSHARRRQLEQEGLT